MLQHLAASARRDRAQVRADVITPGTTAASCTSAAAADVPGDSSSSSGATLRADSSSLLQVRLLPSRRSVRDRNQRAKSRLRARARLPFIGASNRPAAAEVAEFEQLHEQLVEQEEAIRSVRLRPVVVQPTATPPPSLPSVATAQLPRLPRARSLDGPSPAREDEGAASMRAGRPPRGGHVPPSPPPPPPVFSSSSRVTTPARDLGRDRGGSNPTALPTVRLEEASSAGGSGTRITLLTATTDGEDSATPQLSLHRQARPVETPPPPTHPSPSAPSVKQPPPSLGAGGPRPRSGTLSKPRENAPTSHASRALCPNVASPENVIGTAIHLAAISADDVFLDLGCGDGAVLLQARSSPQAPTNSDLLSPTNSNAQDPPPSATKS